jgi:O-acetyl-ADP-ribose deacetylase (regulator of RNase III)
MAECRAIGHCPTGSAVITGAGQLPCRHVIHTVGPIYRDGLHGEAELLASCYRLSIALACESNLVSIAFPSISTGVYGYPVDEAARVALEAIRGALQEFSGVTLVRMVLFDRHTLESYRRAYADLEGAEE